jgi:crossover junction endodeoxyribonuclease RuvC
MLYLGVDPSLNGTGLCLLSDNEVNHISTVHVGKLRGVERLNRVSQEVSNLLNLKPKFVAIESYSYNSVGRIAQLGEVGGIIRLRFFEHGVAFVEVAPALLKKFATGRACVDKAAIIKFAEQNGVNVADDNQADAFVLAMIARYMHTGLIPPTRPQYEVVHRLQNPKVKTVKSRSRKRIRNFL